MENENANVGQQVEPAKKRTGAVASVVALVVILVLALVAYNRLTVGDGNAPGSGAAGEAAGQPVVAELPEGADILEYDSAVLGLDDTRYTLSQLAGGKPLVVNFWATWCPYCIDEMGDFQAFYDEYGDRVSFVMLDAVGSRGETVEAGTQYIYDHEYTFPVYFDAWQEAVADYGVYAFPTTVLYSAKGELLAIQPGRIDAASFGETLEQLIAWE